jgi:phenylalanyl-tRNA synthetase beta chain
VRVFDVYQGGTVPEGHAAFGVRLFFRSPERTLTDGEIDKLLGKMVQKLQSDLGVVLRS